jgi:SAM-dependent methyltransferase
MTPAESTAWRPEHPGGSWDILPWLVDTLPRIPLGGVYVEIGSFFGRALSFVGVTRPDLILYAIDPWVGGYLDSGEMFPCGEDLVRCNKYGGLFPAFIATMQEFAPEVLARTRVIRAQSARGMLVLEDGSVDCCFIDGDHERGAVEADIREALRVVKPGGVIGMHDCGWRGPVYEAAVAALPGAQFAPWPEVRDGWDDGCSSVMWAVRE